MERLLESLHLIIQPIAILLGAFVLGLIVYFILVKVLRHIIKESQTILDDLIFEYCRRPFLALILILMIHLIMPLIQFPPALLSVTHQLMSILLILSIAFLLIRLTHVMEAFISDKYDMNAPDNLRARAIQTQIKILKRIIYAIVVLLAFATILMTFSRVRQIGTSILASAGIVGIIVGFAAQRSIATLLAGIQIAITQPIRLDDVVVIEDEWGRIEEITLTYVVVRIWDQRRLILPITYFLEKPFQNWTRQSAEILGTVFLYVDYTVPVSIIREELQRILTQTDLWDQRVCALQVTNTTDRTVELRALMSAADSSKAWELRCLVRERLIDFLQKKYPNSLPKVRANIKNEHEDY
jgi:small-conductance mechanosensitive channel